MIVVCFGDGLGNQMFQYAFYREMVYKYPKNKIMADICNFYGSVNKHNGYELERIFNIKLPECSKGRAMELADYYRRTTRKHPILNRLFCLRTVLSGRKQTFITVDDATEFYEEIFQLNPIKSYMLRGNWINEAYFKDVAEQVCMDFTFPPITDGINLEYAKRIKTSNSVSIHIRRGDYVTNGLHVVTEEYYMKAIELIKSRINEPIHFFVFSDDIGYCKSILKSVDNVTYVDTNKGKNSFRDMQLMSMCQHNIIANSTFSFWGAYLNTNNEKMVIAPKIGFSNCNNPIACNDWTLI